MLLPRPIFDNLPLGDHVLLALCDQNPQFDAMPHAIAPVGLHGTVIFPSSELTVAASAGSLANPARIESTEFDVDERAGHSSGAAAKACRYVIRHEIARGGVGIIYSAIDQTLGRDVAIKVLQTSHRHKSEIYRRFSEEARITAALNHPGVVPIYDSGSLSDGRPFIVMGLVCGQTLANMLSARRQTKEEFTKYFGTFVKVCQTVAYAHAKAIIHRDLKPGNVMVSPFGAANVMDWGIAKVLSGPSASEAANAAGESQPQQPCAPSTAKKKFDTELGSVMGTLAYMAPEQASGHIDAVDRRADVFGLGGILCEILTGSPPYMSGDSNAILQMAKAADLDDAFGRLSSCGHESALIRIAKRCLAANPDERFADAGELTTALVLYFEDLICRAERDLVRFFELSMDLFCIAGFDGVFHRINANFSKVLGYPDRDLLTRPFLDFVHPDDRGRTIAEMEKLVRGLPSIQFRNRYRDIRGDYHHFEWTAKSIPDDQVIFAVARDVTERMSEPH